MSGFSADRSESRKAYGTGALTGGLSGAATGASVGAVAGPYGAIIGGVVGAIAGSLGGGEVKKNQDIQQQKDAYKNEQSRLTQKNNTVIDTTASARDAGQAVPAASAAFMGSSDTGAASNSLGNTGYDRWKGG